MSNSYNTNTIKQKNYEATWSQQAAACLNVSSFEALGHAIQLDLCSTYGASDPSVKRHI